MVGESFSRKEFCYLGEIIGARGVTVDNVIARISSTCQKVRDLVPLLTNRGLAIAAKGRFYSSSVCSITLLLQVRHCQLKRKM